MEHLSGYSEVSMDDRGRIAIPARYVKILRDIETSQNSQAASDETFEVVVGMTMGKYLGIFPKTVHDKMREDLESSSAYNPDCQEVRSWVLGSSEVQTLDKQNRVKIPSLLTKMLGLGGHVVVRGVHDRLELISQTEFEQTFTTLRETIDEKVRRVQMLLDLKGQAVG